MPHSPTPSSEHFLLLLLCWLTLNPVTNNRKCEYTQTVLPHCSKFTDVTCFTNVIPTTNTDYAQNAQSMYVLLYTPPIHPPQLCQCNTSSSSPICPPTTFFLRRNHQTSPLVLPQMVFLHLKLFLYVCTVHLHSMLSIISTITACIPHPYAMRSFQELILYSERKN